MYLPSRTPEPGDTMEQKTPSTGHKVFSSPMQGVETPATPLTIPRIAHRPRDHAHPKMEMSSSSPSQSSIFSSFPISDVNKRSSQIVREEMFDPDAEQLVLQYAPSPTANDYNTLMAEARSQYARSLHTEGTGEWQANNDLEMPEAESAVLSDEDINIGSFEGHAEMFAIDDDAQLKKASMDTNSRINGSQDVVDLDRDRVPADDENYPAADNQSTNSSGASQITIPGSTYGWTWSVNESIIGQTWFKANEIFALFGLIKQLDRERYIGRELDMPPYYIGQIKTFRSLAKSLSNPDEFKAALKYLMTDTGVYDLNHAEKDRVKDAIKQGKFSYTQEACDPGFVIAELRNRKFYNRRNEELDTILTADSRVPSWQAGGPHHPYPNLRPDMSTIWYKDYENDCMIWLHRIYKPQAKASKGFEYAWIADQMNRIGREHSWPSKKREAGYTQKSITGRFRNFKK